MTSMIMMHNNKKYKDKMIIFWNKTNNNNLRMI